MSSLVDRLKFTFTLMLVIYVFESKFEVIYNNFTAGKIIDAVNNCFYSIIEDHSYRDSSFLT